MKRKFYALIALMALSVLQVDAQYVYPSLSGGGNGPTNSLGGSGSWSVPTVLPNFTFTTSSNGNRVDEVRTSLGGAEYEVDGTNAWESKYGQINANENNGIKVRAVNNNSTDGSPLLEPITTVINFDSPTSSLANNNWGFMVLDIDVDQVKIRAKDASGNYYSDAVISSWFKGAMNMSTAAPGTSPCYDAATATVAGSAYGCPRRETLLSGDDIEGPAAYFEPDVPVSSIEFIFDNLQPNQGTPSQRYFLAAKVDLSMPVKLVSFTAEKSSENSALLRWSTNLEISNLGFEIERSNDARVWEKIGFVNSKTENGDSEEIIDYSFTDNNVLSGDNYYRLKQVDIDGTFEHSIIRAVLFNELSKGKVMLFPNPTSRYITITELEGTESINVYDIAGRKVKSVISNGTTTDISLEGLKEGMYHVQIITEKGSVSSYKVVKSN